jgi:hypothetical protein
MGILSKIKSKIPPAILGKEKDKHGYRTIMIGLTIALIILTIIAQLIGGIIWYLLSIAVLFGIVYFFLREFFGIDIFVNIKADKKDGDSEIDIVFAKNDAVKKPIKKKTVDTTLKKQVFNVSENTFEYDDAGAVCEAYGAKLASYSEIETAYNAGAGWCNYGWSEGQMALFPTQKKTFDKLQSVSGHEHDCGRPGINGGYMANPKLKFGVNCYGVKPPMTSEEKMLMNTRPIVPKTEAEQEADKKSAYWKKNISKLLVSPFSRTNWSRY